VYTSHFRKKRPGGEELHYVIVDNGRSQWLGDPQHWETLKCIRCGSCMNTCPVYRWSGGYSYSYFIPGPLGINLGMLRDPKKYSGNVSACSLCLSCQCTCPVKINLGDQIYMWRQTLDGIGCANKEKKMACKAMDKIFTSVPLYKFMTSKAYLLNIVPGFIKDSALNPWAYGHKMMTFPKRTFHEQISEYLKDEPK
ncbi:MAG: 4Fe-4S dicluster domain-containing protein, partial [Muribaculaceae bacterium]|nr:4Fe-4S dicluster domain-containing protein [Muribaculaceae bacterium]